MLQEKKTIDFGSSKSGGRSVDPSDKLFTEFYVDFISIIGRPLQAVTKLDCPLLDTVTMTFSNWSEPYAAKHASGIDFKLTGRTFRLAKTDKRENWFIVMHPKRAAMTEDPKGHRKLNQGLETDSGMMKGRATCLAAYITEVFKDPLLIGHGVEPCWRPGGRESQTFEYAAWAAFQEQFMQGWSEWSRSQSHDSFWTTNEPAFHCYCYGQNQKILIEDDLGMKFSELELEYYVPPHLEDEETSSEDSHQYDPMQESDDQDDPMTDFDDRDFPPPDVDAQDDSMQREEIGDSEEDGDFEESRYSTNSRARARTSNSNASQNRNLQDEEMGDSDAENRSSEESRSSTNSQARARTSNTYRSRRARVLAAQDRLISQTDGLKQLEADWNSRYDIHRIATMSYALAVCVHSKTKDGAVHSLLADRNQVQKQYAPQSRTFTFYSQAFSPVYGNFSSNGPPEFLASLLTALRGNMSLDNEGAQVLSFGYFQGYSNIKRAVRHSKQALLATKGFATAGMTIPSTSAANHAVTRRRRENALLRMRGGVTPERPDESKPFAREREQLQTFIDRKEVPYRLEQVVSVDMRRVTAHRRTFRLMMRPIVQLIRFFLCERETFTPIFRSIPIDVFPRIMCAYSRLFELALDEMNSRFESGNQVGLTLADSEAVAIFDRLGGYIFTGSDRHLPGRVLRPLGTVESLRRGGWPYIDPDILNIGSGSINLQRWPMSPDTGRPTLLHTDELRFHYGAVVAASRESELWLAQLSDEGITGPQAMIDYVTELVERRWVIETRGFMAKQLRKKLHRSTPGGTLLSSVDILAGDRALAAWEEEAYPFRIEALDRLTKGLEPCIPRLFIDTQDPRTRRDHAYNLVHLVFQKQPGIHACKAATWPDALHGIMSKWYAAQSHGIRAGDCVRTWAPIVNERMRVLGIEWVPGNAGGRIVSTAIVKLKNDIYATPRIPVAEPGTFHREAEETEILHDLNLQRELAAQNEVSVIDFGCEFPFKEIPHLIQQGYDETLTINDRIKAHYSVTMSSLSGHIGHPFCQLMLMLILTICASTETPQVLPETREFSVSTDNRHRDKAQLALVMATRMLWFLFPNEFSWTEDPWVNALSVKEMTKKIGTCTTRLTGGWIEANVTSEHKGTNNRILRQLGWVRSRGSRATPRNTDMTIESDVILMQRKIDLVEAMSRPADFIAMVFMTQDETWVHRCQSIIRTSPRRPHN
ncbi:hypothetical protein E4U14_008369 [Claviceps sp. LM454 group G7]|nr:hypothetical protein E4U14_008369 [Claviceps sp. LM454 group G7]